MVFWIAWHLFVDFVSGASDVYLSHVLSFAGQLCKEKKTFFHTDAAQAAGKIPIDVKDMNINLLSISGHKIYGPKGMFGSNAQTLLWEDTLYG
jgi:cysteine desulfurase